MVLIKVEKAEIAQKMTSLLVIGIFENEQDFSQSKELDSTLSSIIRQILKNREFKGSFGSNITLYTVDKAPMKKIMLIGLGQKEKFTNERARIIAGKAALNAKELGLTEFTIFLSNVDEDLVEAICEGISLSLYSFTRYKTNNNEKEFLNPP